MTTVKLYFRCLKCGEFKMIDVLALPKICDSCKLQSNQPNNDKTN